MCRFIFVILFVSTSFAIPAFADEALAIITQLNSPTTSLPLATVKQIFLRKSLLDNYGYRWIPLNLPSHNKLRRDFSLALFNQLPDEQENYWNEQYFQGISPPQVLASEEAVLRFVEITPGAIGYVHKQNAHNRVKILTVITTNEHR